MVEQGLPGDLALETVRVEAGDIIGNPQAIEVRDWRWVTPEELREMNLTGADREILKALEKLWASLD